MRGRRAGCSSTDSTPASGSPARSTLATPHDFYGVSVFYRDFSQVTDDDVVRLLEASPVSAPE
ncbi:MAG TPA: hypothetical protein VLD36_02420 [Burkholderiales bacterium]|nr:hypothetical protein [Burkholderiales bacterium]